jgi:hypothetical protein
VMPAGFPPADLDAAYRAWAWLVRNRRHHGCGWEADVPVPTGNVIRTGSNGRVGLTVGLAGMIGA